jgi:hypothetical protein
MIERALISRGQHNLRDGCRTQDGEEFMGGANVAQEESEAVRKQVLAGANRNECLMSQMITVTE